MSKDYNDIHCNNNNNNNEINNADLDNLRYQTENIYIFFQEYSQSHSMENVGEKYGYSVWACLLLKRHTKLAANSQLDLTFFVGLLITSTQRSSNVN